MKLRNLLPAMAAASLVAAPVAAQAQVAERASEPVSGESELAGRIGPALIIVAIAAVGMIALLVTDDDDEDPVSV
ncbi:hypothetical protein [Pelagerythrobacter aerophilus]|uniref:Ferrochelatase n=1 Tax=Pelagerythrobacter aerophilus TaxID=2306995 RepID=A0A418NI66_9SPHN|nr:hypothetical protein [Pelagerythrobacter aerophilus]RIV78218.1 hypothetical protein D2V04_10165 [Pelagerythrobacter aerophilus]